MNLSGIKFQALYFVILSVIMIITITTVTAAPTTSNQLQSFECGIHKRIEAPNNLASGQIQGKFFTLIKFQLPRPDPQPILSNEME